MVTLETTRATAMTAPDTEAPLPVETFQQEVDRWLIACFGEKIARDRTERNHRFLEEALELVQAGDCTASEAHQLVDYVFNRPIGEMWQEVGGVMNTLAALCLAYGEDMVECGNREIARCWTKVEKIRAKQAAKPKHSPLPEATSESTVTTLIAERDALAAECERLRGKNAALEAERYKLAYAICGGEDAPGYLDSLPVETFLKVEADNHAMWRRDCDRAMAAEADLAEARKVLEPDLIDIHRDNLIAVRDEALEQGVMDWAVNLSHIIAFLSDLRAALKGASDAK